MSWESPVLSHGMYLKVAPFDETIVKTTVWSRLVHAKKLEADSPNDARSVVSVSLEEMSKYGEWTKRFWFTILAPCLGFRFRTASLT